MKRHSDNGHPYWRETAALPSFPPLAESAEADVAVIGAGIDTAWELTRAGLDVVVLDADRLAAGAVGVEDQARFHPLAYLWGRVDDIVAGGGRTHEGTRVVELDRGTPAGSRPTPRPSSPPGTSWWPPTTPCSTTRCSPRD
ncbi:FAD-dependent oxidoreductase [Streptomyces hydrogenans]|uniref:FAD-dependent oxidoreductase n=1 Tax=Streptomyces hydrogenans TaxID=1873719 RepID=UPI00369560CF